MGRTKENALIEEYLISVIENGISQLKTYLRQWRQLDADLQTYASKRLADKMFKILTSVVAVEEAASGNKGTSNCGSISSYDGK
ncbi:hypothetical protein J32TS6_10090 [Virgibacillus pantothenticus]|uniref:Uncharacterized protein n=1 Tax=Virgibacillus pantothenticus TaxID=1473 RepID=A0A0L0QN30_VIRPA|nr:MULTISPECIES: hypothetical protein [Virgibacillus]API93376.1 hypothetical protein BKP57_17070 [Virgibacillus sp. 6R]KNE19653.1 hypothetical protein AFK71_14435 [Virgibacillus pantothenticus]MBU8601355.1 hypothetical protein [Virgibacillus pantothenticus]MBU8636172.1 hypothetical protein [Virgibacillus pantothenticus]MBU8665629.1 hypothetical protein [Virgibacillus pantothenticus]